MGIEDIANDKKGVQVLKTVVNQASEVALDGYAIVKYLSEKGENES